jgi:hypothetical protein
VKTGATGMIVQAATRKMRQRMPPNEGRMKIARELVRPVGEIYGHCGQRRKQGMNLTLQVGNRIAGLAPEPCF